MLKTSTFFCLTILSILLSSQLVAQSTGWTTPVNFGLIPFLSNRDGRYDDIFFISRDTGVLVSSYGMIFKTYDGADHWELKKAVDANTYFRSVEFSGDGQVGIAGTLSGLVFRSPDRGETWEDISAHVPDTGTFARDMCGLAHHGNTFYGVGWWGSNVARVYKSIDAGITWTTRYLDTNMVSGLIDVTFLTVNKGFATGFRAHGYNRESVVLRTLDGGNTWTKVFSDTTIGGRIWKIQFVDSAFGVGSIEPMYMDTIAMIRTTDGGNTWQIMPAGHVNAWYYGWGTQGVGFLNRQKGWLGGYYNGMFETNDGGLTWDSVGVNAECDRFFLVDNIIYVSANTVYKYTGAPNEGVKTAVQPTFVHKLYPVAPNPSDGNVQIEFDIHTHQTNVVLEVVNMEGKKTYPIASGYLKPGHYSYKWDGSNAANGNYIVWLGTDEIPMVQKFILKK